MNASSACDRLRPGEWDGRPLPGNWESAAMSPLLLFIFKAPGRKEVGGLGRTCCLLDLQLLDGAERAMFSAGSRGRCVVQVQGGGVESF